MGTEAEELKEAEMGTEAEEDLATEETELKEGKE